MTPFSPTDPSSVSSPQHSHTEPFLRQLRPLRQVDGITEWHPSFLKLAPMLKRCSKRYERFCYQYRHHSKGALKCHWGSRMLKRLVETSSSSRSKNKRISPGQMQLPFAFDLRLNQIPEEWHQIAVRFRRTNGIRDGDRERSIR